MQSPRHSTIWLVLLCACCLLSLSPRPSRAQDCGEWMWKAESSPCARTGQAMAYDTIRHRTVCFGGAANVYLSPMVSDTWEWNGSAWEHMSTDGPPARAFAQMSFDSQRGVMVLFGGRGKAGTYLQDTWEWNGVAWRQVASTGPAERACHTMAYDRDRGVTVLYGGSDVRSQTYFGDTWTWDGLQWTLAAENGPPAREKSAMEFNRAAGVIMLYGGKDVHPRGFRDTWIWNGQDWREIEPLANPSKAIWGHRMAYDSVRETVTIFGGEYESSFGIEYYEYMWYWVTPRWIYYGTSHTPRRADTGFTYDEQRRQYVLFGGRGEPEGDPRLAHSDTLLLTDHEWSQVNTSSAPSPRSKFAMAYDQTGHQTVLFGGERADRGGVVGDTWGWDGDQWTLLATTGPEPRSGAAMVFDEARGVTVLFGGMRDDETVIPDTWEWNGAEWRLVAQSGPSPVQGHAMAYDRRRGVTVLFGGQYESGFDTSQLWEWNGTNWNRRDPMQPITGRHDHAMAYDAARGVVVIQGGISRYREPDATWLWDGDRLRIADAEPPGRRAGHSMVFDDALFMVVMFGGNHAGIGGHSDTWAWDGRGWGVLTSQSPSPRINGGMAFDTDRQVTVMFGGTDPYGARSDTWEYRGQSTPILTGTFSCPGSGVAIVGWTCGLPGGRCYLLVAAETGQFVVPSGTCAGTELGLGTRALRVVATGASDTRGAGSLSGYMGAGGCGSYVQLIEIDRCAASNVVQIE